MTDHAYNVAALQESCEDDEQEDIEIEDQTPKGKRTNQAHTPVKWQRKEDQKQSEGNVSEVILYAVQKFDS